ncbi:hypothetical protein OY671_013043, partial [Metschnikowia pulcherrima]
DGHVHAGDHAVGAGAGVGRVRAGRWRAGADRRYPHPRPGQTVVGLDHRRPAGGGGRHRDVPVAGPDGADPALHHRHSGAGGRRVPDRRRDTLPQGHPQRMVPGAVGAGVDPVRRHADHAAGSGRAGAGSGHRYLCRVLWHTAA